MAVERPSTRSRGDRLPLSTAPHEATSAGAKDADNDVEASAADAAAATAALDLDDLVSGDADIAYEQELRRDPYQLKVWLAYLKSRSKTKPTIR